MEASLISLEDQIAELKREYAIRQRVYPKWVKSGRMTAQEASSHQARLAAAIGTLAGLLTTSGVQT